MLDDDLTHNLRVLGLDRLPARMYHCLLGGVDGGLDDLAARVGEGDRDAVEAALQELIDLGLVEGRAASCRPIAPGAALAILERRRTARVHEAKAAILQSYDDFRRTARAQPVDGMETLDPLQTRMRLERSLNAARDQVRVFDTPPYPLLADDGGSPHPRSPNGIAFRTIYSRRALDSPGYLSDVILPAIRAGEQTRTLPEVPVKLHLVDDQIGFVELTSEDTDRAGGAMVVHRSSVLTALIGLFETAWKQALPLDPGPDGPAGQPPRKGDKLLLALLCAGLPDHIAAREMGISERTYYRRLQLLMASTGATTRFQLALHATRAGWIS